MKPNKLLICAHPDDETIFFAGLLLHHPGEFKVICVTDANADGHSQKRIQDFKKALKLLNVTDYALLNFPDIYEKRLDQNKLKSALQKECLGPSQNQFQEVFTHNILGEYGHPHHIDVSYCVHHTFKCPIFSTSYNTYPEIKIELTHDEFILKSKICTEIYGEETSRFLNLLPITSTEGFQRTHIEEIDSIYNYIVNSIQLGDLKKFDHLRSYLAHLKQIKRPF